MDANAGRDVTHYYGKSSVDATMRILRDGNRRGGVDEGLGQDRVCYQFSQDITPDEIEVPMVHAYGAHETSPYLIAQHLTLVEMCRFNVRLVFNHSCSHKMPSEEEENKVIAMMNETLEEGKRQMMMIR